MKLRWAFQRIAFLIGGLFILRQQLKISVASVFRGSDDAVSARTPEESPSSTSTPDLKTSAFAGCLLVLDDNHRLQEWLSFHYHTLPLRMLIVGVDPRSNESPEAIFDLFRRHLNMTIVTWEDKDFIEFPDADENDYNKLRGMYLLRQKTFVQKCMKHLADEGWTWTSLWDTDEYVVYSGYSQTRSNPAQPHLSATSPPDLREPGSVIRYVQAYGEECYPVGRVYVGAKEMRESVVNEENYLIDYRRLDTLRFRYRNDYTAKLNGREKVMLNVQYVNFSQDFSSIHRPNAEACPTRLYGALEELPMHLNHYMSSWESYSWRDDSRKGRERTREAYVDRAYGTSKHYDDTTLSWLRGFADSVGKDKARLVLEGAGIPRDYDATDKIADFKCLVGKSCKPRDDSNMHIQPKNTFSACLVVNAHFRLSEWISYHYHVLPLRYLVVAVDPQSQQSPAPIFDLFRDEFNMTIVAWNESDYTKFKPLPRNASAEDVMDRYTARQKTFLSQCMEHLMLAGRTWTALWDSDEFIVFNGYNQARVTKSNQIIASPSNLVAPGQVLDFMRKDEPDECLPLMRIEVGTKEYNNSYSNLHPSLDPKRLDTLRFQYRNHFDDKGNGVGKVLLNVQSLDLPAKVVNAHRPVAACPRPLYPITKDSPFYLLHYVGTYEAYSLQDSDGTVKTKEAWEVLASRSHILENRTGTWLEGFVSSVGAERAKLLLRNAGLPCDTVASISG